MSTVVQQLWPSARLYWVQVFIAFVCLSQERFIVWIFQVTHNCTSMRMCMLLNNGFTHLSSYKVYFILDYWCSCGGFPIDSMPIDPRLAWHVSLVGICRVFFFWNMLGALLRMDSLFCRCFVGVYTDLLVFTFPEDMLCQNLWIKFHMMNAG